MKLPAELLDSFVKREIAQERAAARRRAEAVASMNLDGSVNKLRQAIGYIQDDLSYDDWLKVVLSVWCIDSSEVGIAILEDWRPAQKNEVRNKFNHLSRVGGPRVIDAGHVF